MNNFESIFEKLARTDDPSIIWTNWLDYVIDQNLLCLRDRGLDFKGHEQEYYNLFTEWVNIIHTKLENSNIYYYDYLGEFYEDVIQSKYKAGTRGQFFTPQCVSELMSKSLLTEDCNGMINDATCGSGRLLLDTHKYNPSAIMIGQDLDPVACKMAVLNFYISGVRGSILNMNTLTGEFYEAWRVNNYLGYGLNIPHIELVNERNAYMFFGYKNDNEDSIVDLKEDNDQGMVSESKEYMVGGTVQSTLI